MALKSIHDIQKECKFKNCIQNIDRYTRLCIFPYTGLKVQKATFKLTTIVNFSMVTKLFSIFAYADFPLIPIFSIVTHLRFNSLQTLTFLK